MGACDLGILMWISLTEKAMQRLAYIPRSTNTRVVMKGHLVASRSPSSANQRRHLSGNTNRETNPTAGQRHRNRISEHTPPRSGAGITSSSHYVCPECRRKREYVIHGSIVPNRSYSSTASRLREDTEEDVIDLSSLINGFRSARSAPDVQSLCDVTKALIRARDFTGARESFNDVLNQSISPSSDTLVELMSLAIEYGDHQLPRRIFSYTLRHDLDTALGFFRTRPASSLRHDILCTSALVQALLRNGRVDAALDAYEQGKGRGIAFRGVVFDDLVERLCAAGRLQEAKAIYGDLQSRSDVVPGIRTFAALVDAAVRGGTADDLAYLREQMAAKRIQPDLKLYTSLIHGLFKFQDASDAADCFEQMLEQGITPDGVLYMLFLNVYSRSPHEDPEKALMWYESMILAGLHPNVETYTNLISMLARRGYMEAVEMLFQELLRLGIQPDMQLYTTIIFAYARKGDVRSAETIYRLMTDGGLLPDVYTFCSLIMAYAKAQDFDAAQRVFDELLARYQKVSQPAGKTERNEDISFHLAANAYVYNTLIIELVRADEDDIALHYLKRMLSDGIQPDSYTCLALLQGYRQRGDAHGAFTCFRRMVEVGVKPNNHIYSALLATFGSARVGVKQIELVIQDIQKRGVEPDMKTWTALMFAYGRAGQQRTVLLIWDKIHPPSFDGGTQLWAVDNAAFIMFLKACLDLLGLSGSGREPGEKKQGVERIATQTRKLIDENLVFDDKVWNILIGGLVHHGAAVEAAEIIGYALHKWCSVSVVGEAAEQSDLALDHSTAVDFDLDFAQPTETLRNAQTQSSQRYRVLIERMKGPAQSFVPATIYAAARSLQPSIVDPLIEALKRAGRLDELSQLRARFQQLRKIYPAQDILNVFRE